MNPAHMTHTDAIQREESSLQRISLFASRVIVIALTLAVSVMLLVVIATSSSVSRLTHVEAFQVTSGSMSPVIRAGSIVFADTVSLADAQRMQVGDIVTFKSATDSEVLITHRIVEVQKIGSPDVFYTTKGDANQSVDITHLTPDRIIGKYKTDVPVLGHLFESMHRFQIVGLFSVSLIFAYISMATNKKNNNKEETTL